MEKATKGLVLIAGVLLLAACGGSSSPATSPPPQPEPEPAPEPQPAPKETTLVFSADPTIVASGEATELRWSSPDADSCTALGAWSGERAPGGRELSPTITEATEFRLQCDGPNGPAERTVRVEPEPQFRATDKYGRTVGGNRPIVIVDWEGAMANPAIKFYLHPSADLALPGKLIVDTGHPRVYLDWPHGGYVTNGHQRPIDVSSTAPIKVHVSSFSDDDASDATHTLTLTFTDAHGDVTTTTLPVLEIDHDIARPHDFNVTVDFAEDSENFFDIEHKRSLMQRAADDWSYYFADMNLDAVAAGAEKTVLWRSHPDGYVDSYSVRNARRYTGFLLYAKGFSSNKRHSAGAASTSGGFQSSRGEQRPLRRSGSVQIELWGEYDYQGWFLSESADDAGHPWWETMDLLHSARHEVGHALAFSTGFPKADEFRAAGRIVDERVREYFGEYPTIDRDFHLANAVDPESLKGAYGNHIGGPMLVRRWMVTKLDLLVAQAIGYKLRPTSAFRELAITTATVLPDGYAALPYAVPLEAVGGIPFYDWTLESGTLPDGLELDRYDGTLFGIPERAGHYTFTIGVEEYGGKRVTRTFSLDVA